MRAARAHAVQFAPRSYRIPVDPYSVNLGTNPSKLKTPTATMTFLRGTLFAIIAVSVATAFSIYSGVRSTQDLKNLLLGGETIPRLAPLYKCDLPPERLRRNKYIVYLAPNYSLEDHKRTVGNALPEGSIQIIQKINPDDMWWYSAIIESTSAVDTIRRDPDVQLVECSSLLWAA